MSRTKIAKEKRKGGGGSSEAQVIEPSAEVRNLQQQILREREEARAHPVPLVIEKYVRGGLNAGEREVVAAHLRMPDGCGRCQKAVDKFRELGDFVDRMPDAEC
nr:hypothetical protein [Streptomyces sp. DSM 41633]